MALPMVRFQGEIEGKILGNYKKKVDYNLQTVEERIEKVREVLGIYNIGDIEFVIDDFWQDVFDMGCCKTNINISDPLYSETDVAYFLESLGTYILSKDDRNSNRDKVRIYNDYDLFKRMSKESEKVSGLGDANNTDISNEILVFVENGNYRKAIEHKVTREDIERISPLKDYDEYRKFLTNIYTNKEDRDKFIEQIEKKLGKINGMSIEIFTLMTVKKHLGMLKTDMLDIKKMVDRPFQAKCETKSVCEPEWDKLDMFDVLHVRELLRVKKGNDLQDDLSCIVMDLDNLMKKVSLTDKQREVLKLWKSGKSQEEIAKILEIKQQAVSKHVDSIAKNVSNEYEKQYEDWYYLNVCKGQYKRCSKCGDIKIVQRFDKNGKRGYMSMCKTCR